MSYIKKPSVVKIDPTVTHLQPDQFDNDDPIQGYPFGTSAMRVTTATGFPETSGDVITSRTTDDTGSQIFIGEKAYIRTFEGNVWSSWRELGESSGGGGPVEWDDIINKPSQFPPSPHTHDIEDTIGLQAALDDKASAQSVNELQQEINGHKAEKATQTTLGHVRGNTNANGNLMADSVQITDSAGHFTATNVEGALAELFQFADDGKTLIADAITAKGVPADPTETFASLAAKIGQISTGKRWASGTTQSSGIQIAFVLANGGGINLRYIEETIDFGFIPSAVMIYSPTDNSLGYTICFPETIGGTTGRILSATQYTNGLANIQTANIRLDGTSAYLTSSGFRLPVFQGNQQYKWIVFE